MKKINFPTRNEIQKCLKKYLVSKVDANDATLKSKIISMTRFWKLYFYKYFIYKKFIGSLKSVARVDKEYTQVWSTNQYPGSLDINNNFYLSWNNDFFEVKGWGEKRIHLLIISNVLSQLKPKTYLEVGCGNGAMLMMLSVMHPDVLFTGVELTEAGVSAAKKMQKRKNLPNGMIDFLPKKAINLKAFKNIQFIKGNAKNLPFDDSQFDFVNTSLALEQMNSIQDFALNEISRVSKSYISLLEPFPDCNKTKLRKNYTKARNYFSVSIEDLKKYNLTNMQTFFDFPQKITRGVGYVLSLKK